MSCSLKVEESSNVNDDDSFSKKENNEDFFSVYMQENQLSQSTESPKSKQSSVEEWIQNVHDERSTIKKNQLNCFQQNGLNSSEFQKLKSRYPDGCSTQESMKLTLQALEINVSCVISTEQIDDIVKESMSIQSPSPVDRELLSELKQMMESEKSSLDSHLLENHQNHQNHHYQVEHSYQQQQKQQKQEHLGKESKESVDDLIEETRGVPNLFQMKNTKEEEEEEYGQAAKKKLKNNNQNNNQNNNEKRDDVSITMKDLETGPSSHQKDSSVMTRALINPMNRLNQDYWKDHHPMIEDSMIDAAFAVAEYANAVQEVQNAYSTASKREGLAMQALDSAAHIKMKLSHLDLNTNSNSNSSNLNNNLKLTNSSNSNNLNNNLKLTNSNNLNNNLKLTNSNSSNLNNNLKLTKRQPLPLDVPSYINNNNKKMYSIHSNTNSSSNNNNNNNNSSSSNSSNSSNSSTSSSLMMESSSSFLLPQTTTTSTTLRKPWTTTTTDSKRKTKKKKQESLNSSSFCRSIAIQTNQDILKEKKDLKKTKESLPLSIKDIQTSLSLQKPRFCKRLFCSPGTQATDDFFVENVYIRTTTFMANIVALSGLSAQFSITPKLVELAPGMRSSFKVRFHAAVIGTTSVLLLITDSSPGRPSNTNEILYQVVSADAGGSAAAGDAGGDADVSKKQQQQQRTTTFPEPNPFQKKKKKTQPQDLTTHITTHITPPTTTKEDVLEPSLGSFSVFPSHVKLTEQSCNLDYLVRPYTEPVPTAAPIRLTNHTKEPLDFQVDCVHEHLQVRPKTGNIPSKESIYLFVWAICKPSLANRKKHLPTTSPSPPPSQDWYGTFTVSCGKDKRELSVVLEKQMIDQLATLKEIALSQHVAASGHNLVLSSSTNSNSTPFLTNNTLLDKNEHEHTSKPKKNKKNRGGLYFYEQPHLASLQGAAVGQQQVVFLKLCNRTSTSMTVFVQPTEKPFHVRHQQILLQAKSYLELPIYILPTHIGVFATIIQVFSLTDQASQQIFIQVEK